MLLKAEQQADLEDCPRSRAGAVISGIKKLLHFCPLEESFRLIAVTENRSPKAPTFEELSAR